MRGNESQGLGAERVDRFGNTPPVPLPSSQELVIVDYIGQPLKAKEFADMVDHLCSMNRRRLGYKGYFNTNGDAILTAYLAGYNAATARLPRLPKRPKTHSP